MVAVRLGVEALVVLVLGQVLLVLAELLAGLVPQGGPLDLEGVHVDGDGLDVALLHRGLLVVAAEETHVQGVALLPLPHHLACGKKVRRREMTQTLQLNNLPLPANTGIPSAWRTRARDRADTACRTSTFLFARWNT